MTVYPEYIETVSKLIPRDFVVGALVFPVQSELNAIHVCMLNPTDARFTTALEGLSGCRVHPVAGHEHHLQAAIARHYGAAVTGLPLAAVDGDKATALADTLVTRALDAPFDAYRDPAVALVNRNRDKLSDAAALEGIVRDPDLVRFVHQILVRLVRAGASDIHFEPLESEFRVRSRIDGAMRVAWTAPPALAVATVARLKVMAGLDMAPSREPLDSRISYDLVWGREVDFRFSSLPSLQGEKIVLRALDRSRKRQAITELGFDETTLERVRGVAEGPNGLILVTGPTGSGKTSTLYALVDHLNREDVNIVSAEDPVESKIRGVTQVYCGEDTGHPLRGRFEELSAPGPGRHPRGRDPRPGDRGHRAQGGAHRSSRHVHAPHERRSEHDSRGSSTWTSTPSWSAPRCVSCSLSVSCGAYVARAKPRRTSGLPAAFSEREAAILKGATIYAARGLRRMRHTGYRGAGGYLRSARRQRAARGAHRLESRGRRHSRDGNPARHDDASRERTRARRARRDEHRGGARQYPGETPA